MMIPTSSIAGMKMKWPAVTMPYRPPAVRCACETFGVDRFVFGTDFPYINDNGVRATAKLVSELPYDDASKAGIREGNLLPWVKL